MFTRWFSLTPGENTLFAGLVLAVTGIALVCVAGHMSAAPLNSFNAAGLSLLLTGVLLWIYGAIKRQSELLNKHEQPPGWPD